VNLPSGFSKLESFVPEWALANERDRYNKLHHSSLAQLKVFYDAMLPEMEAVMEFLKTQPLEGMQPEATNLYHLAMTFAETAHPLDLGWKDVDFPSAFPWERMEFRTVSTQF
jgi:hypothetical protein